VVVTGRQSFLASDDELEQEVEDDDEEDLDDGNDEHDSPLLLTDKGVDRNDASSLLSSALFVLGILVSPVTVAT